MRRMIYLVPCMYLMFFTGVSGQTESRTTIEGRIIDAETGGALGNAIVYLADTPLGNSTGIDGKFKISFVNRGKYQLVISRVGYEQKKILIEIGNPDSLYYEIKLQPEPVRTREIEILAERPKVLRYGGLLFPKDNPQMYCVYSPVSSVPIGVFYSDSAFYMYSLEMTAIDSQKFIRLWLLYKNQSQTPNHFNPMECVKLHMDGKMHSYNDIRPLPASTIYAISDSGQTVKTILASIGKSITNLAIQHTKFILQMGHIPGGLELRKADPAEDWSLSGSMYGTFRKSISYGVLERYLVSPGCSVDGYIYFSFPGNNPEEMSSGAAEAWNYVYQIEIMTQTGSKFIEFVPR